VQSANSNDLRNTVVLF